MKTYAGVATGKEKVEGRCQGDLECVHDVGVEAPLEKMLWVEETWIVSQTWRYAPAVIILQCCSYCEGGMLK